MKEKTIKIIITFIRGAIAGAVIGLATLGGLTINHFLGLIVFGVLTGIYIGYETSN